MNNKTVELNAKEMQDLRVCIETRVSELRYATDLRRPNEKALENLRMTGREALRELDRLYTLREKFRP